VGELYARAQQVANLLAASGVGARIGRVSRQERHRALRGVLRGSAAERRLRRRQLASRRTRGRVHRERRWRRFSSSATSSCPSSMRLPRTSPPPRRLLSSMAAPTTPTSTTRQRSRAAVHRSGATQSRRRRRVPAVLQWHHRSAQGCDAHQRQLLRSAADGEGHVGARRADSVNLVAMPLFHIGGGVGPRPGSTWAHQRDRARPRPRALIRSSVSTASPTGSSCPPCCSSC
jgi:hypothetical protein